MGKLDVLLSDYPSDRLLRTTQWLPSGLKVQENELSAVVVIPQGYEVVGIQHKKPSKVVDPLFLTQTVGIRIKKKA